MTGATDCQTARPMQHFYARVPGYSTPCLREIYSRAVKDVRDGGVLVELGSFLGSSAAFMGVEIANSGKSLAFHAIDTWEGSPELGDFYAEHDVYRHFCRNIEPVRELITTHRMTTLEAAKLFPDASVDFCFVDAAHDYDSVAADIKAWLPKMKPGSLLAGHDYNTNFLGVVHAVADVIGRVQVVGECWMHQVEG